MIAEKVQKLEQENISLKSQLAELEEICANRAELPKNCEYCSNFIQHYIKCGTVYAPMHNGHCAAGKRTKTRKTEDSCRAFVKREYGKNLI